VTFDQRATAMLCVMLGLFSLAVFFGGPARAGSQIAIVNATGGTAIPPDTALSLAPKAESALNDQIEPKIRQLLASHGYRVVPSADLRLTFALSTAEDSDALLPFGLNGTIGSESSANISLQIRLPRYWKNRPLEGEPYNLSMTLVGQGGRPLWQGTATARIKPLFAQDVAGQLATALIARLGQTVRDESIPLD
jgi:hypothetical protein